MIRIVLTAAALTSIAPVVRAQAIVAASEVLISATRLPDPAGEMPYSVTTVAAEQLAGSVSMADALARVADIHVQAPGGRSGVASVFLRGADPNFTTVLLDGVVLNDSTNSRGGSFNVSEIDAASLDRIDIVAGPLSGLFGSGALAGAINLSVPGGARATEGYAMAGIGTPGDYSGTLRVRGPLTDAHGASLTLSASDDGDASPGSTFSNWSLTGKISPLQSAGTSRVIARFSGVDADAFPDGSGGARFATRRTLQNRASREALLGISQRVLTRGAASVELLASWLHRQEATASPGVAPSAFNTVGLPAGTDESTYRRATLQAVARYGTAHWSFAGGTELQREHGVNVGQLLLFGSRLPSSFDRQRDIASTFAEVGFAARAWIINIGVRADDVTALGTHVTARGGARYQLAATGFAMRAAAGTGFKAPSFYALGNPLVGNPALRPERSVSSELGFEWHNGNGLETALTVFRARYTDLIDFDPGPPPRLVNRSAVTSRGVSATFTARVGSRLTMDANAQRVATVDERRMPLLNRPQWRASAGVRWAATPRVSLQLSDSYVGGRDDYAIPTGVRALSPYHRVSADATFVVSPATVVRVVVDNALDDDFEEAVGFQAPRARARLTLTQRF